MKPEPDDHILVQIRLTPESAKWLLIVALVAAGAMPFLLAWLAVTL